MSEQSQGTAESPEDNSENKKYLPETSTPDKHYASKPLKKIFGSFEKSASSLSESPRDRFVHSARPDLTNDATTHQEPSTQIKENREVKNKVKLEAIKEEEKEKEKEKEKEEEKKVHISPSVEKSKPKKTRKTQKKKPRIIYPYPCELCGKDVIEIKRRKL